MCIRDRDDLEHPEGRLQPVADGRTVTQHPGYGLDRSEPKQHARPGQQSAPVPRGQAVVDCAAERVREERLGEHPDDSEGDPQAERAELMPPDPQQKAGRRAGVRAPGWVKGSCFIGASLYVWPGSTMMRSWPSARTSR